MGWNVPADPSHFNKVAKFLLARGYEGGKQPRSLRRARAAAGDRG
jgi:hypothetical protein